MSEENNGPLTAKEARLLEESRDSFAALADREKLRAETYRRALIRVLAARDTAAIEQALQSLLADGWRY